MAESINKLSSSKAPSKGVEKKAAQQLENIADSISSDLEKLNVVNETVAENNEMAAQDSSGGGDDSGSQSAATAALAAKRERLINSKPAKSQMVAEIRGKVHKELSDLQKQKNKYASKGTKELKQLNEVVSKIRALQKILSGIVHATYEQLKKVWLRVVHDIV